MMGMSVGDNPRQARVRKSEVGEVYPMYRGIYKWRKRKERKGKERKASESFWTRLLSSERGECQIYNRHATAMRLTRKKRKKRG